MHPPANYSIAYEETQLIRVSDFRDCVCPLFPKAILFDFIQLETKERKYKLHYSKVRRDHTDLCS